MEINCLHLDHITYVPDTAKISDKNREITRSSEEGPAKVLGATKRRQNAEGRSSVPG